MFYDYIFYWFFNKKNLKKENNIFILRKNLYHKQKRMSLPKEIQKRYDEAVSLLNILEQKQNQIWEENIFFQYNPDIVQKYQNMLEKIVEWAEELQPSYDSKFDKEKLRNKLHQFYASLKEFRDLSSVNELPQWMIYYPAKWQKAMDFFDIFFDKIQTELSKDFKDNFDKHTPIKIQEWIDYFKKRKKLYLKKDKQTSQDIRNQLSDFLRLLVWSLKMTWTSRFTIRKYTQRI